MADDDQLDILIKVVADATGAKVTADQIELIKTKLGGVGIAGEKSFATVAKTGEAGFEKVGAGASRMSFRTAQAMQGVVTSTLGIQGPLDGVIRKLEYVQFMSQRMGLSIFEMFSKFAAGIAGVVGATLVINKAVQFAKEADAAWEAAGLTAQGFWKNLAIGYGIKEMPKISQTIDFQAAGLGAIEERFRQIKKAFDDFSHVASVTERAQAEAKEEEAPLLVEKAQISSRMAKRAERIGELQAVGGAEGLPILEDLRAAQRADAAALEVNRKNRRELATPEQRVAKQLMADEEAAIIQLRATGKTDEARSRSAILGRARAQGLKPGDLEAEKKKQEVLDFQEAERKRKVGMSQTERARLDMQLPAATRQPVAGGPGSILNPDGTIRENFLSGAQQAIELGKRTGLPAGKLRIADRLTPETEKLPSSLLPKPFSVPELGIESRTAASLSGKQLDEILATLKDGITIKDAEKIGGLAP